MTKKDIDRIVIEAIRAKENSWSSWAKTIITFIFIPIITVYATVKVLENKVERLDTEVNKKVDYALYEQFIIKQIELQKLYNENTSRIEDDSKQRDEEIKAQTTEIKEFLNSVYAEKKLWIRDYSNKPLYSNNTKP